MATTAKKGFTVEVSCPGCGGDLELEDNFFVLECHHCGSCHRIVLTDSPTAYVAELKVSKQQARFEIDRYLKENKLPLTHSEYQLKQMYYPYWKIDAVLFRVRKGVEKKVVLASYGDEKEISYDTEKSDISLSPYATTLSAGMQFESLPETLGLRSDYIKLYPFSEEKVNAEFDILPLYKSWEDMRNSLHQHVSAISSYDSNLFGVNKTEISCPKAKLLYFPFYVFDFYEDDNYNRFVVDGVSGRILNHTTSLDHTTNSSQEPTKVQMGNLEIVSHRCHNCGIDLPTEESLVYICNNCQVITDLEPGVIIDKIEQAQHEHNPNNIMVPFWSFKLKDVENSLLKTVFGGIYNSDRVVVPAFKVQNYNAIFRLTKRMSAAYPQYKYEALTKTDRTYTPVNLALNQAVALTELFIKTDQYKKNISHKNRDTQFQYEDVTLFYAPFHLESYFYVDSILQAVTFEKKLL